VLACCQDYLALLGCWRFKVWGGPLQRPGMPDLICCLPTRRYESVPEARRWRTHLFLALEIKTGRFSRLSPAQSLERQALLDAGAVYVVAGDVSELVDALVAQGLAVPQVH
jgi:hypothetical protein